MSSMKPLDPEALYHRCDPQQLTFETTSELEDLTEIIGQGRAVDAVRFGIGISRVGSSLLGEEATHQLLSEVENPVLLVGKGRE
jgi:hypothetical protein